jgi:hypothetical protein
LDSTLPSLCFKITKFSQCIILLTAFNLRCNYTAFLSGGEE